MRSVHIDRQTVRKRVNAARFGVALGRSSTFKLPAQVRLNGRRVALSAPNDDRGIRVAFAEIVFADCYRLRDFPPLRRIVDVGANVGIFTLAARQVHPNAVIHAYEPNTRLAGYLDANAATANATVFYEAVGRNDGWARVVEGDESVSTTTILDDTGSVPVVSWDRVLSRIDGADLVKLDCEGAEWELFERPEPWGRVQAVAMELHCDAARDESVAIATLQRLGFTIRVAHFGNTDIGIIVASR